MKHIFPLLLLSGILFAPRQLMAWQHEMVITHTNDPVTIDGNLNESCWQAGVPAKDFGRNFPVDQGLATAATEVRLACDGRFLYFSAVCYQRPEDYTVQTLRRDFENGTCDVVNFLIDPYKDGLNGFLFSVNPYNVQREALIDNGVNLSYEWDNVWYSAVARHDDRWVVEIAVPFNTLRYKVAEGENTWHVNFVRTQIKGWEVSSWKPVPQQYAVNNLAFYGIARWSVPPPKKRPAVSLIPYLSGGLNQNVTRNDQYEKTGTQQQWPKGIGGDVKVGVTPSLNLDLTFNPDFSQVEVDRQVANLSRFQLFFPERRQFFLENRDLFATFGFPSTRPFFSRRIGLADTSADQSQRYAPVPILYGARLSGKVNDQWRVGLLNMQTRKMNLSGDNVLPAANYSVATLQRKVLSRSAISAIYTDKEQFLSGLTEAQSARFQSWNRVAGLEFNLYSKDNRWEAESYYHRSFSPDPKQRGSSMAQFVGYTVRHYGIYLGLQRTDTTYSAEMGFVPRPGVQDIYSNTHWIWYPNGRRLNTVRSGYSGDYTTNLHFGLTDADVSFYTEFGLKNQSSFGFGTYHVFTRLFDSFDPSNTGKTPLPAGDYTYHGLSWWYEGSTSYDLQGNAMMDFGQFFNGKGFQTSGEIRYRIQPYGTLGVSFSYVNFDLPAPYSGSELLLLGPSASLAFTRSLFVGAFFQYNTQTNNFNINTRLQWRFAPVSDIYLVYTDNSYANAISNTPVRFLTPKNKAIVLKVVYWLNI